MAGNSQNRVSDLRSLCSSGSYAGAVINAPTVIVARSGFLVIFAVSVYFLFRLPIETYLDRGTFAIAYGTSALLISIPVMRCLGFTRFTAPVLVYALYLVMRFVVMGELNEIIAISLFQYLVPLGFFMIGVYLWRRDIYAEYIPLFVIGIGVSLFAGLLNYYFGWADTVFMANEFDMVLVADVAIKRCGSLAGNSLGTGFLAMTGTLLAFALPRWQLWLLPVFILSIVSTLSRGAIIMLFTGACVWTFTDMVEARVTRWRQLLWGSVLVVVGLVLLGTLANLLYPEGIAIYRSRFAGDIFNFDEIGNLMRLASWQSALAIWSNHPIFGIGYGTLGATAVKHTVAELAPESMYLKILGELGAVGLVLYLATVGMTLFPVLRRLIRDGQNLGRLPRALLACVASILLGGVFLQNIEYDFFAILFWFFLGGLAGWKSRNPTTVPTSAVRPEISAIDLAPQPPLRSGCT